MITASNNSKDSPRLCRDEMLITFIRKAFTEQSTLARFSDSNYGHLNQTVMCCSSKQALLRKDACQK
jgi:hypothetical protein